MEKTLLKPFSTTEILNRTGWLEKYDPEKKILKGNAYIAVKRLMDFSLVLVSAPLWLPLLGLIAMVIKMGSPLAPAFFSQWRTGAGGKRFRMLKLRTMVPEAESLKKEIVHLNELKWPDFKIGNDPRVTKFGRFLRKTSLDEIPQLLNVISGSMSLVGPRPTSFESATYELWQTERLEAKPGMTGLWQVIGRGSTEFDTRTRLDIKYIEHRCIFLDLEIILRTIPSVFKNPCAF